MKYLLFSLVLFFSSTCLASVKCNGTVAEVYKWNNFETISILLDVTNHGKSRWISMPTKSDEAMALMAFATQSPVEIYMSEDNITSCIDGWSNNKALKGYFVVRRK